MESEAAQRGPSRYQLRILPGALWGKPHPQAFDSWATCSKPLSLCEPQLLLLQMSVMLATLSP